MKRICFLLALVLLGGCAASPDRHVTDAVADFIQVAELTPEDSIRTRAGYSYSVISERYVILKADTDFYLVEFTRDCRALYALRVPPDYRYDKNTLSARFDTIRGCRIARLYGLEEWQAEELKNLGDAPGDQS